jgi:hypothetical protein
MDVQVSTVSVNASPSVLTARGPAPMLQYDPCATCVRLEP